MIGKSISPTKTNAMKSKDERVVFKLSKPAVMKFRP